MRIANRLLAVVVSLGLAAAAVLVAINIVLVHYLDRRAWLLPWQRWHRGAGQRQWDQQPVVLSLAALAGAGVVLLAVQLWRRPPPALALTDRVAGIHTEIPRRALERALTRAALTVDGITDAHARATKRRIVVHADTERRLLGDLRARVSDSVQHVLDQLDLDAPPPLRVTVSSGRPARAST